jgi:hypothetical protein
MNCMPSRKGWACSDRWDHHPDNPIYKDKPVVMSTPDKDRIQAMLDYARDYAALEQRIVDLERDVGNLAVQCKDQYKTIERLRAIVYGARAVD